MPSNDLVSNRRQSILYQFTLSLVQVCETCCMVYWYVFELMLGFQEYPPSVSFGRDFLVDSVCFLLVICAVSSGHPLLNLPLYQGVLAKSGSCPSDLGQNDHSYMALGQMLKIPTGTTSFGLFFLLPIYCFGYPVTHSHMASTIILNDRKHGALKPNITPIEKQYHKLIQKHTHTQSNKTL